MESTSRTSAKAESDVFRLLVQSVKDYAIFFLDREGRVATWNEGAERIKGYSAAEIIGREYATFFPPEDVRAGKPARALRTAAAEGRWIDEGWRVRSDGTRFWASVVLTALYEDGTLIGYAKVTRDLTERMRAESERLRLLEMERGARAETELALHRLRTIQRLTDRALRHLDLKSLLNDLLDQVTDILKIDDAAILLFGDDGERLEVRASRGRTDGLIDGLRFQFGSSLEARVAVEKRPVSLAETRTVAASDAEPAEESQPVLGVPLMVSGDVIGVLRLGSRDQRGFSPDDIQFLQIIADRMALSIEHARLIESETQARRDADIAAETLRARDKFLTVAAHELKTPMTALQLATELLARKQAPTADPDEMKPYRVIDGQLRRLNRVVDQVLDATRSRAGAMELHPTVTDLTRLLRRVVRDCRLRSDNHEIVLTVPNGVRAVVDAHKLEQVFSHLLDNAIKFSPYGGRIHVALSDNGPDGIRLSVRDHGLGVTAEQRPHLFGRFHQAHANEYRSGIGLGLYLCKEIVTLHGGTIDAEFPDDGGTRFVVNLPRETESPEQLTEEQEAR